MIYIDELKDFKLYNRPFYLPRNGTDKRLGGVCMLLTPNIESTKALINDKNINNKFYTSFYLEKDVSFYINENNLLEGIPIGDRYIHEEVIGGDDGYVVEGVYRHQKRSIIYNGFQNDVDQLRCFFSDETIRQYNADLKAPIKYPIYVTVSSNKVGSQVDKITPNSMYLRSRSQFGSDTDYKEYIDECVYELIVKNINPEVNMVLCDAVVMTLSGTYKTHADELLDNPELRTYTQLCNYIDKVTKSSGGWRKLYKIIKTNNVGKIGSGAVKLAFKDLHEATIINEAEMDPVKKLKRSITYHARRGSAHLTNKIDRIIDRTLDSTVKSPDFTKSDDPNLSDVKPPTINDIKNQIEAGAKGQGVSSQITKADHNENEIRQAQPKESALLDEEYTWFDNMDDEEDCLRCESTVSFLNEAGSSNPVLYKILYKERLKNNRMIMPIYDEIKTDCPSINYTFLSYKKYKGKNLFVDLHYYNELYFKNTMYKAKRGMNLYLNLLEKMLNDPRLTEAGYTGKRCLIIPVRDWDLNPKTKMWLYTKDINPISIIYNLMTTDEDKLKKVFGNIDVVFYTPDGYFKINFAKADLAKYKSKFIPFIKILRGGQAVEDTEANQDSKAVIVNTIIDDIEDSKNIKISHLVGDVEKGERGKKDVTNGNIQNKFEDPANEIPENKKKESVKAAKSEADKVELIKTVGKAANSANTVDDAKNKLDQEKNIQMMIAALSNENQASVQISSARESRMNDLNRKVLSKKVDGKTVDELLKEKEEYMSEPLEPIKLTKIDSINPEWQDLKFASFAHQYNVDSDIMSILISLTEKSYPLAIVEVKTEDTSTSEDYITTYSVQFENHDGKRFSIKFDIPIIVNDQYMMLRGNKKVISIQSFLAPIVKTDPDTCQIVSNYNKIFIRRFGDTTVGKSNEFTDRIIKALKKIPDSKKIKVDWSPCIGDIEGMDLPIDLIDFANVMREIDTPEYVISFDIKHNIDNFKNINLAKGIPIGYTKNDKSVVYYNQANGSFLSSDIYSMIDVHEEFRDAFASSAASTKYVYSKASILSTEIPLIVVAAYCEGLTNVLDKAGVIYEFKEKLPTGQKKSQPYQSYIKFSDGYLLYNNNYSTSLLLNGLKECPTDLYSVTEVNNKTMYLEFLDNFGGRLKADGIDNFYDCMIDPITKDMLTHYKMPTDFVEVLIYANNLLADTKYFKHGDQSCRRWRKNEIIAGYTYKALAGAYGAYATQVKHGRTGAIMSMKRSAVIDAILLDPTAGDLSIINCLNEKESYDQVTTKGLSGMNSDRSYSLDKRAYDDSMANVLSMSTGFAATVGVNRQATLNANIDSARGFVNTEPTDFNSINSMCMSEALTPFGTTRDDPFRSAMTFIQTTRHGMKVAHADPLLVTNGADEALPYLISDTFAHKAKEDGEIVEMVPDDYMIVKYKSGRAEYITLKDTMEKNSSVGFYVDIKLDTNLKQGSKVKKGDIIAYDRQSFDPSVGINNNPAYKIGTLAKVAMLDTDEGYEDSAIVSDALSEAMTSVIYKKKELNLNKNASIFNLVQPGTPVEEGDVIATIQAAFEEDDANILLKKLSADEDEVSELGRVNIKSSVTGWIQDIEIARTVDMDELSPSLQKVCKKYENDVKKHRNAAKAQGVKDTYKIGTEGTLAATGRLKDAPDGVKITIYMAYEDKFSVGDKLVYWSANKGVTKQIFPKGEEPYSLDRPDEKIHTMIAIGSVNGRMVTSIQNIGIINRLLIEASRKAKDILGIDYKINLLE